MICKKQQFSIYFYHRWHVQNFPWTFLMKCFPDLVAKSELSVSFHFMHDYCIVKKYSTEMWWDNFGVNIFYLQPENSSCEMILKCETLYAGTFCLFFYGDDTILRGIKFKHRRVYVIIHPFKGWTKL